MQYVPDLMKPYYDDQTDPTKTMYLMGLHPPHRLVPLGTYH
jgi:hypothetical protein